MKNITKFPHSGAILSRAGYNPNSAPIGTAVLDARANFRKSYKREPDWDIIRFRGAVSTTHVVIEIWEEP